MKSLRQAIQKSWFPEMRIISGHLATSLQLATPLSLAELTRHLDQPEEKTFKSLLDGDALHGEVEFIMRSDGTYTFRGHLRATGLPSFAYKLQAVVRCVAAGVVIAMETSGRVFGSDTPGDRERGWNENSKSESIRKYWMALRSEARFDPKLDVNIAGLLGGLADVGKTVIETYVAAQFSGIVGAVIVLGSALGSATGVTVNNPNILAGVTVGGGILIVFGPSAIIPALAAGTTTALLTDVRFRRMNDDEIALARKVFTDKLPIDRIRITDLYQPGQNAHGPVAREFCVPGIDGSILVNMGKNFGHTLGPDVQWKIRKGYEKPGEVLIHELTHAWQIHHNTFFPGLACKALLGGNYEYDKTKVQEHAPWSSTFGLEEQASIVDDWFGENVSDLNSAKALNDDRFFYISQHIRLGRT
jgi:hypothetical protein